MEGVDVWSAGELGVDRVDVRSTGESRLAFKGGNNNIPRRAQANCYPAKGDESPCVPLTEMQANRTTSSGVGQGSCMVLWQ